ncbi:MAG: hypothetical protein KC502_12895 [Myxococcales bacterium]|nr:hypothetical protein [Myxococcales bacterium]
MNPLSARVRLRLNHLRFITFSALLIGLAALAISGCGTDGDDGGEPVITDPNHPSVDPFADLESGVMARYELDKPDWHAQPFPSDLRRDATTGQLDLSGFPTPKKGKLDELLTQYMNLGKKSLDGWSIQPTIYVQLDGPINKKLLPDPKEAMSSDKAGMMLVNIDPASAGYGERLPLRWKLSPETAGNLLAKNMLMVQPTWGTPLRPKTTYAFVLSRKIRDNDNRVLARPPALAAAIDHLTGVSKTAPTGAEEKLAVVLTPLWKAIEAEKVPVHPMAIAAATVFTTGTPTAELQKIASFVRKNVTRKAAKDWQQSSKKHDGYRLYRGVYSGPNFQAGTPPYMTVGGGFEFDDKGDPKVQATEQLRISIAVPDDRSQAVGGLLPVVIYSHGTGGSYESYRGGKLGPGKLLTQKGLVVIGIDQPLHGPRAGKALSKNALYLASFNFLNPAAGRTTFRQAALDNVHLIEMLRDGKLDIPSTVSHDGKAVQLDSNRMLFMGHSQGGIVGPLLASVEPNFRAFVFSGAGAGLSLTAVSRKDIVDFPALIEAKLNLDEHELSEFHPAVSLIQLLVDATDPLAYARHVFARKSDKRPPHVLLTEGLLDAATPAPTSEALAAAMGLGVVKPAAHLNEAMEALDTPILERPVTNNLTFGTHGVTGVVSQYPKGDHYVIFDDPKAAHMARDFLFSVATTGEAIIE